jgi:hypothetical protein
MDALSFARFAQYFARFCTMFSRTAPQALLVHEPRLQTSKQTSLATECLLSE